MEGQHVVQQQQQSKGAHIIIIITNATINAPAKVIYGESTVLRTFVNEDVPFIKPLTKPFLFLKK